MTTKVQEPAAAGGKTGSGDAAASGASPALALLAGWLVPGAGHLLLGKWVRAGLLMVSIVGMFAIGIALAGKVYTPNTGEPLDMLGFAGDLGSGLLYGLARLLGWGQAPVLVAGGGLWDQVHRGGRAVERRRRGGCAFAGQREEAVVTISHFSAVLLFSLFTSIVFGITQRAEPKKMVRFGALCFALFVDWHHRGELGDVAHQALNG